MFKQLVINFVAIMNTYSLFDHFTGFILPVFSIVVASSVLLRLLLCTTPCQSNVI